MSHARLALSIAVFLALAGAVWLGWSLAVEPRAIVALPSAPSRALAADVSGFEAQVVLPQGSVRLRLGPLHADAQLQAFDAVALRRRLALADGEPFALEIELASAPAASAQAPHPNDASASMLVIDAALLRVHDERGVALEPIAELAVPIDGAPADPLRALVTARTLVLGASGSTRVVLWGRAPRAPARLSGWLGAPIEFTAQQWHADALEDVLARSPNEPQPGELTEAGR